jgi:phospholipase C
MSSKSVATPILNQSSDPTVDSICGSTLLPAGAFNDRCGYCERLPIPVISSFAKRNYADHTTLDTTSILAFIEDNWSLSHIDSLDHSDGTANGNPPPGQGSFDRLAGSISALFDFDQFPNTRPVILDDITGEVIGDTTTTIPPRRPVASDNGRPPY